MENNKKVVYGVIILGTFLAAAISLVPHYNAAYRFAFGLFLWSAAPYYAYLLLSGVASGTRLILPGVLMISIDVIAKGYQAFNRDSPWGEAIGLYIPIVLLMALAVGYVIGTKSRDGQARGQQITRLSSR